MYRRCAGDAVAPRRHCDEGKKKKANRNRSINTERQSLPCVRIILNEQNFRCAPRAPCFLPLTVVQFQWCSCRLSCKNNNNFFVQVHLTARRTRLLPRWTSFYFHSAIPHIFHAVDAKALNYGMQSKCEGDAKQDSGVMWICCDKVTAKHRQRKNRNRHLEFYWQICVAARKLWPFTIF